MKTAYPFIKLTFVLLLIVAGLFIAGCDKDDDNNNTTPQAPPSLLIELTHKAGSALFHLDSTYFTELGEDFTPSMFKYYISNIMLVRTDNSVVPIPETYFLVNQEIESSMMLEMDSLPTGEFKSIRFMLGVDSARNVSGAQTGALDPVNGMYWGWLGYIHFKLEGTTTAIPSSNFKYHVGGYESPNNNTKQIEISFDGDVLPLENGGHPELHLVLDVLEVFKSPVTIDFATYNVEMAIDHDTQVIATNYADMFRYDHMHVE